MTLFRRVLMLATTTLLLALLSGCTESRLAAVVDALETRQIASCIEWSGHLSAYVQVKGVTATGGATLADCRELR